MKRIESHIANIASALLGFVVALLCFKVIFVALGHWVDGENFGSPGYTDYGLGMFGFVVGLPLVAVLTFVFARTFRRIIGNRLNRAIK